MKGHEFFENGELKFPKYDNESLCDGTYRTVFGPSVGHNGIIYGNTDHNFGYAMRRLTGSREPGIPGWHDQLFYQQTHFIRHHQPFYKMLSKLYSTYFEGYLGAEWESRYHHADPHAKRALRIMAHKELEENGFYCDDSSSWLKSALWKMKKNEYAKPGKKPRSIGDLGVMASLLGFRLTNFLKTAQASEVVEINGGELVFCKSPDPFELERHFQNLLSPRGRFYYLYFSDDACLAIRDDDGVVHRYNLDISSCDSSHGPAIFDTLINMMPEGLPRDDMKRLITQCESPLRVVSQSNPANKLKLKPTRPMLYSGSTITTAINNLANLSIGLAISECDFKHIPGIENPILVEAAEKAGYIITGCTPLEHFEDVQFLKNSPVLDTDNQWRPMLNYGVFARASGTCDGDLPGKGGLQERAYKFQQDLIACTYPYTRGGPIDIMRQTFNMKGHSITSTHRTIENIVNFKVVNNPAYPHYTMNPESFCTRYRLESFEYIDICEGFARSTYGQVSASSGLSKILNKDYGLHCNFSPPPTYLFNR